MDNKKTILVVDDIHINTVLLKKMLELLSYHVITAESAAQALALLKENTIDLIMLDLMMPVMNGFELLNVLRDDPATREIPVIITSALSGEDETLARNLGAKDYLVKPINSSALKEVVAKHLA